MIHHIPNVLSADQLITLRQHMQQANWVNGKLTAGTLSAAVKKNQQLAEDDPLTHLLSEQVIKAVWNHPLFVSAALPHQLIPPLFNRYEASESFGFHVDNAIRLIRGSNQHIRTDVSCTLFLSDPEEYDGGELIIEDTYGFHEIKLPAGDLILYPSTSLHQVTAVTRGCRMASFFWVQSMIRNDSQRHLLFSLDESIQSLRAQHGDLYPEVTKLTSLYHNLIRMWAEV
ncbi:MAG: Fe2+-dependent dioxygenase [Sphingobacteriales bacterium]|nr:MAG: Fe2+-dependent dioxygenase [Sphingobacteriales bacterium]